MPITLLICFTFLSPVRDPFFIATLSYCCFYFQPFIPLVQLIVDGNELRRAFFILIEKFVDPKTFIMLLNRVDFVRYYYVRNDEEQMKCVPEKAEMTLISCILSKKLITIASENLAGLSEIWLCTFDHSQCLTRVIIFHKRVKSLLHFGGTMLLF